MVSAGLFTTSDLATIRRAAFVAQTLTGDYFDLSGDEWDRNPYGIYTRKEVDHTLHQEDAFALVVRYQVRTGLRESDRPDHRYGIVLQDPNILLALLRSREHDLWTLGLFVLTHELIHIIRFRRFGVDFFASVAQRDREERFVDHACREILSGVSNTDYLLALYHDRAVL